ncbi:hypothetical protein BDZ45DRAFT_789634 [Acephala macrosclerotiorum]|nr:hypothetical protein BDZ45DRAFT_789634 [Acephala macrosclerotiorum]
MQMLYECVDHLLSEGRREVNRPGGGLYSKALKAEIDDTKKWIRLITLAYMTLALLSIKNLMTPRSRSYSPPWDG